MKFPIKFIIALCALIIGISGIVVCAVPYYGAEKVVYQYIKAAHNGDAEKMFDCTVASEISGVLGSSGLNNMLPSDESDALIRSVISIPSDAVDVKSVKVLGCSKEAVSDSFGTGYEVTALIKAVYTDTEGESHEIVLEEGFDVISTGKNYKIYG